MNPATLSHRARGLALSGALVLAACGGGGGDATTTPAPTVITQAEALRLSGQAVMDVTALAWSLASDVQNTLVLAPTESPRTTACPQGGQTLVTRPVPSLLRIEHQSCRIGDLAFGGLVEADGAVVTPDAAGTQWSGSVRMVSFSSVTSGSSARAQTVTAIATGSGTVSGLRQPLALQFTGLTATRTPTAIGREITLGSASLSVQRLVPIVGSVTREMYELAGCVALSASALNAELCIDAGSRIALLENIADEQLTGRLRWNAGTPGGFDARLRITPGGATGSGLLRIELDLDNNGSFEAVVTLDRSTGIGLRL